MSSSSSPAFVVRTDKSSVANAAAELHQHDLVPDSFSTSVAFCVICRASVSQKGWRLLSGRSSFRRGTSDRETYRCTKCEISLHRGCAEESLERNCGVMKGHDWKYSAFVLAEEPNVQCTVCRVRFSSSENTLWRCLHCFCKSHPHCRAYAERCVANGAPVPPSVTSNAIAAAATTATSAPAAVAAATAAAAVPTFHAATGSSAGGSGSFAMPGSTIDSNHHHHHNSHIHYDSVIPLGDKTDDNYAAVLVADDDLPRNKAATLITESAREALFKGTVVPSNIEHPDPGELIACILSIPCPIEIKQRDVKRKQERALVFHNLRLITEVSIAEFENHFIHYMGTALSSFYQLRMRDGLEWDQILYSALLKRRATIRSADLVSLDARLRFLRDVAGTRRPATEASLLVGCANDLMQNLEWLAVDPDSSIIGLRASPITSNEALRLKIPPSDVNLPPLLPPWLKEAPPGDAKAWCEQTLGSVAFVGARKQRFVEEDAARLRCVQNLRPGDVALLRTAHASSPQETRVSLNADFAATAAITADDGSASSGPTMIYVRLLAWRHDGALIRARVGSRAFVVDPAALFGVPFDINDALRRVPPTIERHIHQAADTAFRAANQAVVDHARELMTSRGIDVVALDALSSCKQLEVHPMLASLGVLPPPDNPSAAYAAGGAVAWPIVTPALARKVLSAVTPLRTLTQLASLPPTFSRDAANAAATAVERTLKGAPGSGWGALSTAADVFVPTATENERSSAKFAHESIARMYFGNLSLVVGRVLERLEADVAAIFSKKLHDDINRWYLTAIERATPAFLASRGYDIHAIPHDYLSVPPHSLFTVRMNFRIVQEVLNPRNDRHGFTLFLNELSTLIYARLDEYATLLCCAIDRRVAAMHGAPSDPFAPPNWFASDEVPLSSEHVDAMLQRSPTAEVTKMLGELKYIVEMRELEQCKAQERGELSQVVPVTGLIVNYLMRVDNEVRTVLTRWDPKFNQEAVVATVASESAPEIASVLLPDDEIADGTELDTTTDDVKIPRELESNWSSASLPTVPYNLSSGPLILARVATPHSPTLVDRRQTIYQQLPGDNSFAMHPRMSIAAEEDTTNKVTFWQRVEHKKKHSKNFEQ
jgi:hypothetical protein